jgi:hypothetical protein
MYIASDNVTGVVRFNVFLHKNHSLLKVWLLSTFKKYRMTTVFAFLQQKKNNIFILLFLVELVGT